MVSNGGSWGSAAWVLGLGLLLPATVQAGWPFHCDKCQGPDCPRSEYSCCHYWFPAVYRIQAYCHPVSPSSGIPCSDIPTGYEITKFPCRAVDPAVMYVDYSKLPRAGVDTNLKR
jgi:hypothetical protein